jgi:hypothetical protein
MSGLRKFDMQIDPKRYYIFDCNNNMIGNLVGYKNHSTAQAQTERKGFTVHQAIWRAFSEAKRTNPDHKLIYFIKAGRVFA